ncbi:MAG: DUF5666 domain-containing protein, partial [Candidatus Dormibacteraeota bacterium]|nr:DUF5666 domain-containing protein [Candidatus Dormibacteraeota bacterium]
LLGVGILGVAGGTTALAVSPTGSTAATGATQAAGKAHRADVARGTIIARSDSEITIERAVRDKSSKKVTKDDTKFEITPATKVFKAGSKDPLGHDALKVGERVRVRFQEKDGHKNAVRVVVLPDARAGKVVSKGNDRFVVHTREHGDVTVVVTDKTRYRSGKEAGSFAGLKVGDHATALGEEDSAHNFDASAVRYHDAAHRPATAPAKPAAQ